MRIPKYRWSRDSAKKLSSCDEQLELLFDCVLSMSVYDLTVLEGLRSKTKQKLLVMQGKSKTMNSKHLTGHAVDVGIYRNGSVDFEDTKAYYVLAGVVKTVATQLDIHVRWGGDWDSDGDMTDQDFNDLVHWELVEPASLSVVEDTE